MEFLMLQEGRRRDEKKFFMGMAKVAAFILAMEKLCSLFLCVTMRERQGWTPTFRLCT
jgi:hypothetical protein